MKRIEFCCLPWLIVLAVVVLLNGCAAETTSSTPLVSDSGNARMERLLTEAGFTAVPQDSALCRKVCSLMPPNRLTPQVNDGQKAYGYFSPESRLLYMGNETAYQNFLNLAVQQNVGERYRTLDTPRNDPEFWRLWQDRQGGG